MPSARACCLGLLALTDPILALVAPGMAWAVVLGQGMRRAARPITVTALASALVVAPWVVRNARVHGEFVAIKSTFGYAFWQGNCALSEGTDKVVRPSVEQTLAQAQGQSARPERLERLALGGAARGGIPRRHRPDGRRLSRAGTALRARAVAPALPQGRSRPPRRSCTIRPALSPPVAVLRLLRRDQPQDPEHPLPREPPRPDFAGPGRTAAQPGARSADASPPRS